MKFIGFENERAREQTSTLQQVGPYTVHLSFVSRSVRAAVSKRGQVIHRCADIASGVAWSAQRVHDIRCGKVGRTEH